VEINMRSNARGQIWPWLTLLSISCALFTLVGIWVPELLFAGIAGALFGVAALRRSVGHRVNAALAGGAVVVSSSMAFAGGLWHVACYRSEAPPGALRVDFSEAFDVSSAAGPHMPDLIGQTICLKGYAYPTGQVSGLDCFLFSADGSARNMERAIGVIVREGELWNWDAGPLVVTGKLIENPRFHGHRHEPLYLMKDAAVSSSRTPLGVASRSRESGC
jgi:hypothetical protein